MNQVAILVPTMNRADFIIRQLQYYVSVKSPHPVYIGDASDDVQKLKLEQVISRLRSKVRIYYYHWPELNDRQTIAKLARVANEKYCAFIGDDDFFVPSSLSKCADFLAVNPEYRTAQGNAVLFQLDTTYGSIDNVEPYWVEKEATAASGVERLIQFSDDYWVPQFSVHRTNEFCADSTLYSSMPNKAFGELLHSFMFIARGQSKFIDCLYMARQAHKHQYNLLDPFDWLLEEDWLKSHQIFQKGLLEGLIATDSIDESEALAVVKQAFWGYLQKSLSSNFQNKYGRDDKVVTYALHRPLREFVKKIPVVGWGLKKLNESMCKIMAVDNIWNGLSLSTLCCPTSVYHESFMPIKEAVNREIEKA